ncbi:MAG: hypothetical protein ACYDHG_06935 [Desulfomonilaceae bacterium]
MIGASLMLGYQRIEGSDLQGTVRDDICISPNNYRMIILVQMGQLNIT